ncbi:MAG: glucose-6-phosphate dehydrogenase [Spirochaetales bacterium]|nr:glucose-6-phosphate dehydrogenase [Spirochaetales bacterium]
MGDAIVLFGATGDLSRRKILPALNNLLKLGKLPSDLEVVGLATRQLNLQEFFDYVKAPELIRNHLSYLSGDFKAHETYEALKERLAAKKNIIFYLATPPSFYVTISSMLAEHGIATREQANGFHHIIVEKPFGMDLESARELNKSLLSHFNEDQIFRIDHYLGKETVQNIAAFRFSNGIFEPIWNRRYIDFVTITVAEDIGVENRGKYFEEAGMLRDIVQNHLLQVLALIAMEPPVKFDADNVRDEKVKVFRSIRKVRIKDVIRGQYKGYHGEENVASDSMVETFVGAKFYVENWRWAGVPFYIRTGKKLPKKTTEVVISFRQPPMRMFDVEQDHVCGMPNQLVIGLQPESFIDIRFGVKKPGPGMDMMPVDMKFNYSKYMSEDTISDYQRLLLDCYKKDLTLFARNDGVEACWQIIDPIEEAWQNLTDDMKIYKPGSWGPELSDIMDDHCHGFQESY